MEIHFKHFCKSRSNQLLNKAQKRSRKVKAHRSAKAELTKYGELTKCVYCKNLVENMANHINYFHQVEAYFTGMKAITTKNIRDTHKICD